MKAKDIMCKNVLYVSYDDSLIRTASVLKENNIGFLPVVKEGKVVGVITDRDLCILGFTEENNFNNPIENIISKIVIAVNQEDSIEEIYNTMEKYRIKRVLVHEEYKIVGVISLSDLLTSIPDDQKFIHLMKSIYHLDQTKTIEEPKVNEFYL